MLGSTSGPICLNERDAGDGIGVIVERQAAIERGLAEQKHAAGVAVARGEFAEAHQRIGIAVLAHVAENRERELAFVEFVEQLHGADDLQPFDPAAAAARDAVQFELRQAELGARELAVIAGRLLGGAAIGGAGLLRASRRFRRAALPIAGARERGRIGAADADAGEMLGGDRRVLQEAQRNPARGEFLLGLVDVARGKCGVPRNQVGGAVFADVEHLARQQAPLDPPFVEIVQTVRILRRRQHELRGLVELLFAAEPLDPGEHVAGVAVQFAWHRIEQRLEVGGFLVGRDARLGQRDMAEPSRLAARMPPASCSVP